MNRRNFLKSMGLLPFLPLLSKIGAKKEIHFKLIRGKNHVVIHNPGIVKMYVRGNDTDTTTFELQEIKSLKCK